MVEGYEALQNSIGLMRSSDSVLGGALSNFELKESEAIAARVKRMFSQQAVQFPIEGLTPGVAVKVFVSAVNAEGSECRRSAPGEGTPAAQAARGANHRQ
jgi:hypothetical protein